MLDKYKIYKRLKIHRSHSEKGGILLEVVVALVVLGVAIIPLTQLSISNSRFGGEYMMQTQALMHAQQLMEQIVGDRASRGYDTAVAHWASYSDTPSANYSRTVSISEETELNSVTYRTAEVSVTGPSGTTVSLVTWLVE